MGDPRVALGGMEGELLAKWQGKEGKRIATIQRRQVKELEHTKLMIEAKVELEKARARDPDYVKSLSGVFSSASFISLTHEERDKIERQKQMTQGQIDALKAEVEVKSRVKQQLIEEMHNKRKEEAREREAHRRAKQLKIEEKLAQQEQDLDRRREKFEEKELHKEQVLVDVSINRVLSRKERLEKELARAQKAKALAKRAQNEGYRHMVEVVEQKEKERQKKLEMIKQRQEADAQLKQSQRSERLNKLRKKLQQVDQADSEKRERYQVELENKREKTERWMKEFEDEHRMTVQEREQWRSYVGECIKYRRQLDNAWVNFMADKNHRVEVKAREVVRRRDMVQRYNREQHIAQSDVYGQVKDSFDSATRKVIRHNVMDKLPEVKMKSVPGLKPLAVPPCPKMPEVKFSTQRPSVPPRITVLKGMRAGQKICGGLRSTI
eukprot:CAMPEP_0118954888 /NCGR_PEP_ID=MMETSP1169-20130426/59085_1 /TAXON_ID=36882 /ORGANISM="Pyramimonas obovata, Strain CCMP722" /LENGTH=437 /DNA_ID=CAMNT_0006902609 /DNA_START=36 /DNA_END=1352 /DNA_ORIENTATION=-